jgi:hypothetical protein
LAVWLSLTRDQKGKTTGAIPVLLFSGALFALTLAVSGYFLAPQWFHRVHFDYKLEDQFGRPVSGATIRRHTNFTTGAGDTESVSDEHGLFQESCKPGESFSLTPRKEGYALASLNATGAYSEELRQKQKLAHGAHILIVVKMWRMQGAEPLVGIGKTYKFHYTTGPINFDLLAGQIVPSGGDLKITVNRPSGEVSGHNPQKWSIGIEVVDGGFIETSDKESAITFAAPKDGYQSSGTFGNNNGTSGLDKSFFLKSRNGQMYSKLGLSFGINRHADDPMYITFGGVANTNSSRNWEATAPQAQ